jgi:hypothetical protein
MTVSWRAVALGAVVSLLLGVAATEAVARNVVAGRIAAGVDRAVGVRPNVDLGATPVLAQLGRGSFDQVGLTAADAAFRGVSGLSFDARLWNLRPDSGTVTVDRTEVTATLSTQSLTDTVTRRLPSAGRARVTTDPAAGTMTVHLGPAGLLTVSLRPVLDGATVALRPAGIFLGSQPAPPGLLDLGDRSQTAIDLAGLPLHLTPTDLTVTGDGLTVRLSGDAATLTTD